MHRLADRRNVLKRLVGSTVLVCALPLFVSACAAEDPFPKVDELHDLRQLVALSKPPPSPTNLYADDPRAAALGKVLFEDTRLSSCDAVACSNCHPMPRFVTSLERTGGCFGTTTRNAPTLINVAFRNWFYWDGQKDSLWSHSALPLTRQSEMASSPEELREDLQHLTETDGTTPTYRNRYAELFGAQPQEHSPNQVVANFGKSIEAYLRTLVQVESPFDTALREFVRAAENDIAEGAEEKRVRNLPNYLGLKVFTRKGCILCHNGSMLSDEAFHNLGVDQHGAQDRGRAEGMELVQSDPLNGAGEFSDDREAGSRKLVGMARSLPPEGAEGAFKTPSLRNVAISGPYLHTGKLTTLAEVIDFYDRGGDKPGTYMGTKADTQKPLDLTEEEKEALLDLLESLTANSLR